MAQITILFGVVLILLGLGAYFGTGMASLTALIPALAGALLLACGIFARDPGKRKHAMHAAAAIGLLGFLGCIPGVIKLVRWVAGGDPPARPPAVYTQAVMALILLVFVILCVKSFVDARRARAL